MQFPSLKDEVEPLEIFKTCEGVSAWQDERFNSIAIGVEAARSGLSISFSLIQREFKIRSLPPVWQLRSTSNWWTVLDLDIAYLLLLGFFRPMFTSFWVDARHRITVVFRVHCNLFRQGTAGNIELLACHFEVASTEDTVTVHVLSARLAQNLHKNWTKRRGIGEGSNLVQICKWVGNWTVAGWKLLGGPIFAKILSGWTTWQMSAA